MTFPMQSYSMDPEMDPTVAALARRYQRSAMMDDPVTWAKEKLKVDTYSKQREILRLLEIVPKLAVPSCHDAGKSFIAALAAARFLAKWPPGTARVVSTAPSMTQVRAILWNEINSLHARAKEDDGSPLLPGRVNQTEWWIGGYMAGIGRKPSDYAPETFSGLHAEHILIIIDEAGGVPNEIWTGVDTLATNEGAVILAIGNPDDPQTEFKNIVEGAENPNKEGKYNGWTVVRIPAWETPNLSGEICAPIFKRVLVTVDWVEDKRDKWGEDSGLWASKVAAEFPDESQMTVIRVADVTWARNEPEEADITKTAKFADVQLGIDIAASETGDETIIRERRGRRLLRRWAIRSGEPDDIMALIVQAQMESQAATVHIDATGVGFGFISDIRNRIPGIAVIPYVAAAQAMSPKEFENRRAETHWQVRDALRRHELDFSKMEHADETIAQMVSVRYRIKKGRVIVEPKDDIRRRIDRSPDDSDAAILAIVSPDGRVPVAASVKAASKKRRDGDHGAPSRITPDTVIPSTPRAVPERIEVSSGRGLRRSRTLRLVRRH